MAGNNHAERLHAQVRERLSNADWDRRMATAIVAKRRTRSSRIAASSVASLAVAALVVVAFMFRGGEPAEPRYESFISTQLNGTHSAVFHAADAGPRSASVRADVLVDSGIDAVIDDTLAMR